MNTIKKILIPVDFSESSENAIKYVLGMTKNDSSIKCDLIFIAPDGSTQNELTEIREKLQDVAAGYFVPAHIEIECFVKTGKLVEVILKAKKDLEADLIIMGTSGSASINVESHTSHLIEAADCPVLVVPKNTGEFELKNIALAIDNDQIDDSNSLTILHDIARWYDAKIHLLTVDRDKPEQLPEENKETLEYYLDTLDYRYSFAKNTDIEVGLKNYMEEKNIDILAIMPRNHAKHSEPSEGQLTKTLALHSSKPLLVID